MIMTLDGTAYPVSKQWAEHIVFSLGTLSFTWNGIESARLALLDVSNARDLTSEEEARLSCLTHVRNCANAIKVIGAHHDPIKEWGLDGWDAVHGQGSTFSCGCMVHEVVDHHAFFNHFGHNRAKGESERHLVEPRKTCRKHRSLKSDPVAHREAVIKDHQVS